MLVALYFVFAGVWTDLLWYRSLGGGFSGVYTKLLWTKVFLFFGGGLLMAGAVAANMIIAYRLRPAYRPVSVEQQGLERYRSAVDPHRKLIAIGLLVAIALFTGLSASGQAGTWLAFLNRTSFGTVDPQFHLDVGFYVFTYPFLRVLLGFGFVMVVLSLFAAVTVHYLYGGLRLQGPGDKASPSARAHLSVLVGLFVLLKAVAYWLDRWGLAFSERGKVTGPSYTDVNAVLPAKTILAAIALICAILFFVNIWRRGMMLPGVGLGLLILSAVLVGGVYPLLIQQFQVKPNEVAKEAPFIERNIDATRRAYGIDKAVSEEYGSGDVKVGSSTPNVRLLDPAVMSPTFQAKQQVRGYYKFPDPLDIDRYPDPKTGKLIDTLVAVRELPAAPAPGWVNEHLVYTHGYGMVAAPGNSIDEEGAPAFSEGDIPPKGQLKITEPRVYFGENSTDYSVVGTNQLEFDYPEDKNADGSTNSTGQANNSYAGNGGVPLNSTLNKLLYATKFKDRNLLLSGAITDRSRILYERSPRDRVLKAAPWLTVDSNAYPAVIGGRIVWILDGYTTTAGFPYSERVNLDDATRDTNTALPNVSPQPGSGINYIRNSVKATVDAYTGNVTLYTWNKGGGDTDPVLRTWKKAFPGTVQEDSAIPADLRSHLRYPEDLFKVQRGMLAKYHVTDARSFYGEQDFWQIPDDPTEKGFTEPPFYLTMQLPKAPQQKTEPANGFALTSTFVAKGSTNLSAFMAVDSVPESDTYGVLRVLQAPRSRVTPGPGLVQNTFQNNEQVKSFLTLVNAASVDFGNLLTIPFGDGFLYVEPVFVKGAQTNTASYPLLRKVLVSFDNNTGFADTFSEALRQALTGTEITPDKPGTTPETPTTTPNTTIKKLVDAVDEAYKNAQAALKSGDLAKYAEAQKKLGTAINALVAAQNAAKPTTTPPPATTTPPPAPSATPTN
ncbi:UPF0182 family protein [Actinocorallia lasiicapitis]